MGEFLKVLTYQEARDLLTKHFRLAETEILPLELGSNRVLAADIISPENLPAFTRSTVDGFAVNCEDTFGSSENLPGILDYAGTVLMGQEPNFVIEAGQCAWVPTGGMLPFGSNAVVMMEYTEKLDDQTILIFRPAGPWENVMQVGEDIAKGEGLFNCGKKMRAQDIGLLASLGFQELAVLKSYKVGVLSTGDEIIPLNEKPELGQVRDVNTYAIASALQSCGAIPATYPIVADHPQALKAAMASGLKENDILLVSGGSSVGVADYTLEVMLSFPDSELLFHGIAMKPGKPSLAVRVGKQLIIGLPGHPVSALMVFHIICAPLLQAINRQAIPARLLVNVASQAGRDDFIPVRLITTEDGPTVQPLLGKSGLMNILAKADGYIHIAYEKQGLLTGESVNVNLF